MFFEVKKDRSRKRRLLLRIQSAYILENPSKRLLKAEKMRFHVILSALWPELRHKDRRHPKVASHASLSTLSGLPLQVGPSSRWAALPFALARESLCEGNQRRFAANRARYRVLQLSAA